jgi:NitT/TauT family transport system substrate-binding protein
MAAGGEYIVGHPSESADIQSLYTGVDHSVAERVLRKGYVTFNDLAPDRGRTNQVMELALHAGMLNRPCDLDAFLDTTFF